ncbi:SDR family NAD(P)-dependent oxidoreductase [Microlunatus flavus]|uniref:SDR family NAD(P)-dependent oxidoreductase n=1 Tax=Microlunatus flavus TaxID=1036181 RepID=UPI0018E09F14|nr:glucose 1-dehydrogenase [Microlunatus flavus]
MTTGTSTRLEGRVALVTGAAGGIGAAIARGMAAEGARVVVADVQDGARTVGEIEAAGGQALAVTCDVADPAQVDAAVAATVEAYGSLDVLVNDAGISGGSGPAHELDVETWLRCVAVNLTGPFLCVRAAMPHLLASGRGRVINIASTYGIVGAPGAPAYCATKGGVVNLTRQLAVDYSPLGVRVNAILPGYIDTDMGGYRASLGPEGAAAANARRDAAAALQPIGRQAHAEEIATVAVFLASDESSFMTGAIVPVDGGCTVTFRHP